MTIRAAILSLLLLGTLAADQLRVEHREGTTGNFTPVNLTTLPNYVLTFDSSGKPVIGAAVGGVTDGNKGDISVSGSGASWVINPVAVTLGKMANLAQGKIIGRATASAGIPEALTLGADFTYAGGNIALAVAPQAADADLTDLAGLSAVQGDILIGNGTGDWVKLTKGTANQLLRMNAGATLPEWATVSPGGGNVATDTIWDAAGDLAVGSGADTAAKLTKGTALQVLRVNAGGTNLEWAAAAGGGDVTQAGNNAFTGINTFSRAGAASTPAMSLTGVPFTGGTTTTTKPLLLIEPNGTTSTGWGTTGTLLGVNAASGFTGNLIDAQVNGVSKTRITNTGQILVPDGSFTVPSYGFFNETNAGIYKPALYWVGVMTGGTPVMAWHYTGTSLNAANHLAWASAAPFSSANDLFLNRQGAANLRIGNNPSATPLAQTITLGEASRPGTDSNTAGANGTIQSGLGTGTGTASQLVFQTPTVAASGSATQTYATRMTVAKSGMTLITDSITATDGIKITHGGVNPWDSTLIRKSPVGYTLGFSGRVDSATPHLGVGENTTAENGAFFDTFGILGWGNAASSGYATDLVLARLGAANLRQGKAPSATPVAQNFTLGEASRPGTDSNTAGASGTIQSGLGTGTGPASSLVFQTPTTVGSGSTVQTYATRLSLNSAGATIAGPLTVTGGIVGNTGTIGFTASDSAGVASGKAKGFVVCPYAAIIAGWSIVVDTGTCGVKVWRIAAGTAKPTTSINAAGVFIGSGTAVISSDVSDFGVNTPVAANDIFAFEVITPSGVTEMTFQLKLAKL